jgi:hypothetical protein
MDVEISKQHFILSLSLFSKIDDIQNPFRRTLGFREPLSGIRQAHFLYNEICIYKKAIPLQAWTGPEGSRWLRLTDL